MKTVEAQGYNKEQALVATGLDVQLDQLKNATQKWKKAGSPMNTKELNKFAEAYIKANKCIGIYVVVDGSSDDTRERPYSFISEKTDGKRKMKRFYQVLEGEFAVKTIKTTNEDGEEVETKKVTVIHEGEVAGKMDKKSDAEKLAKELTTDTHKNYILKIVNEVVEGKEYAGYVQYTPSKSAKLGKFVFFTQE